MWSLDFTEDFTLLPAKVIKDLEAQGVVTPQEPHGERYYSFQDILILRTIALLQKTRIDWHAIGNTLDYLKTVRPNTPLSSFVLLHDGKHVYTILDGNQIRTSQWGQRILEDTIQLFALGSELERTRQAIRRYEQKILKRQRAKTAKVYSPDEWQALLAG